MIGFVRPTNVGWSIHVFNVKTPEKHRKKWGETRLTRLKIFSYITAATESEKRLVNVGGEVREKNNEEEREEERRKNKKEERKNKQEEQREKEREKDW